MQVCTCMAVHANSNRKTPLRRVARTLFDTRSASTKAGALKGRGQAVLAWDATSRVCAPEQRRPRTLLTPSGRSHTCAAYCPAYGAPACASMPNATNMGTDQADPKNAAGGGFGSEACRLWAWPYCFQSFCEAPCEPSQRSSAGRPSLASSRPGASARLLHWLVCPMELLGGGSHGMAALAPRRSSPGRAKNGP
jgi:hypothetical protein